MGLTLNQLSSQHRTSRGVLKFTPPAAFHQQFSSQPAEILVGRRQKVYGFRPNPRKISRIRAGIG